MSQDDALRRTAFLATGAELARQVREAELDHAAFSVALKVCVLGVCRAMCCHDGVMLGDEELGVLESLVERKRDELSSLGWRGGEWRDRREGKWKTRTSVAADSQLAEGFPAHFPKTRCVFLDPEHRCVLQRLAVAEGRHPWHWKPVSCWMHPLLLRRDARGSRIRLTLAGPESDPLTAPGYPGFGSFTPCGVPACDGVPAWQALRGELEWLGEMAGRDLVRELSQVTE